MIDEKAHLCEFKRKISDGTWSMEDLNMLAKWLIEIEERLNKLEEDKDGSHS